MTKSKKAKDQKREIGVAKDEALVERVAENYDIDELRAMYELSRRDEGGQLQEFYAWKPYKVDRPPYNGASPQEECLRSDAKLKIFYGSNRSGKTYLLVHMFVSFGMGFEPFTGARFDTKDRIGWIATEPDFVESLFEKLVAHAPKDEFIIRKKNNRLSMRFKQTGFLIRMKSFAQPTTQYEGEKVYAIGSDEEMPEHLYQACRTRLIDLHGTMIFTVTPVMGSVYLSDITRSFDKEYQRAMDGRCGWWNLQMEDNPHLTTEAVDDYKEDFLGDEEEYRIRIGGEFINRAGSCPFANYLRVMGGKTVPPIGWFRFEDGELVEEEEGHGWALWSEPVPGYAYAIGADPGGGTEGGSSNSAAWIVEAPTGKYVGSFAHQLLPIDFAEELMLAGQAFNDALLGPEGNNSMGGVTVQRLLDRGYRNLYRRTYFGAKMIGVVRDVVGWKTDMQSKRLLVDDWCHSIGKGDIFMPDGETVNEMRTFVRNKKHASGSYGYGPSSSRHKDDRVMAAMIAWQVVKQQRAYVDDSPTARYRRMTTMALEQAVERHNAQFEDPEAWFGV